MTAAWDRWPDPDQLALRGGVLLGALAVLAAAHRTGDAPGAWPTALLLGLALLAACRPDSTSGLAFLLAALLVWARTPDSGGPWTLLAAAGMVLAHVSLLVAAHGPATLPVDRRQLHTWSVRGSLVWLAAAGVWALARVLPQLPDDRLALAAGLLVVAGAVLAGGRWLHTN